MNTPQHIAIIMDGNGRWANARDLPRWEGHKEGATRVRPIVEACKKKGVKALTIFAFSEQNWGRPEEEITLLMELGKRSIYRRHRMVGRFQRHTRLALSRPKP